MAQFLLSSILSICTLFLTFSSLKYGNSETLKLRTYSLFPIYNIIRWFAGFLVRQKNESSNKRPMFHVLFFFHNSLQNSLQKIISIHILTFGNLIFSDKFTNIRIQSFECPKSIRNYKKNNAWNIGRLVNNSYHPANQGTSILHILQIDKFQT